eukprot:10261359-Alexandrium_andersonii.AAC.1
MLVRPTACQHSWLLSPITFLTGPVVSSIRRDRGVACNCCLSALAVPLIRRPPSPRAEREGKG